MFGLMFLSKLHFGLVEFIHTGWFYSIDPAFKHIPQIFSKVNERAISETQWKCPLFHSKISLYVFGGIAIDGCHWNNPTLIASDLR